MYEFNLMSACSSQAFPWADTSDIGEFLVCLIIVSIDCHGWSWLLQRAQKVALVGSLVEGRTAVD